MPWTWFVIAELTGPPIAMFVMIAIVTVPTVVVVPIVMFAVSVMMMPVVIGRANCDV